MNFSELLNRLTMGRALMLGVGIAIIYYFLLFDDGSVHRAAIAQSQQQIADFEKQIADSQKKLDQAAVYKRTVAEVGGTITKLLSLIPEKFGMPDLMRIISNEAKVAGSSLATLTPKNVTVSPLAKEFEELTVTLELQGSFLQHMMFLSNLTKQNQILVVRRFNLNVTKEGHGDDPTQTKFSADIVAYRYRGPVADDKEKSK